MKLQMISKLALANLRLNMKKPLVEIELENIHDRLANKVSTHHLLKIFDMDEDDASRYYCDYNNNLFHIQEEEWLKKFLGYTKKIPYWVTPWGGCAKDHSKKGRLTQQHARDYTNNLKAVRDSIKSKGYDPGKYGYITGQLLIDEKGRKKFIIWNGHRRILSLASLGYEKVKVEVSGGDRWDGKIKDHTFSIKDVSGWINVKNGLYSVEEAKTFLRKFFEQL